MKQQINEIKRMQQLAGILNEEIKYTDKEITDALKKAGIVTDDDYGDRWAVTIGGIKKIRRDTEGNATAVKDKLIRLKILPRATFDVIDTRPEKV